MTALRARINEELKAAMRAREQTRLSTLRLISAAIKDRDLAQRADPEAGNGGIDDADVRRILGKMVKQRRESVRAYEEGGRLELAEHEQAEIAIIEEFLPRKLTDAEMRAAVDRVIRDTGATSIRDTGRVMGELKSTYSGQMDFAKVGPVVKSRLTAASA